MSMQEPPPVARDHRDLGESGQPRLDRSSLPVGQQIDDPALLQIPQQRAVALATLPGEIVDAKDVDGTGQRQRHPPCQH